jgi:hypothetical protein
MDIRFPLSHWAELQGTTAKNMKAAKMTRCTMPWSTVVRPVPNVMTATRSTVIESALIVLMMLSAGDNSGLARDTVFAAVMKILQRRLLGG